MLLCFTKVNICRPRNAPNFCFVDTAVTVALASKMSTAQCTGKLSTQQTHHSNSTLNQLVLNFVPENI